MAYSTLLFGGIGTLVETSQQQLDAFNQAFQNLDIDFVWDEADYAASLVSAGGQNRLGQITLQDASHLSDEQIKRIHAEKTRLYNETIERDGLNLRDGVADLLQQARTCGVKLGWAMTTSRKNIEAICRAVGSALSPSMFVFIGDATQIDQNKPAPDIYAAALSSLGIGKADALAIEDSPTGVAAATGAGLYTVAFPGRMHPGHDFDAADEIVISLADVTRLLADSG